MCQIRQSQESSWRMVCNTKISFLELGIYLSLSNALCANEGASPYPVLCSRQTYTPIKGDVHTHKCTLIQKVA